MLQKVRLTIGAVRKTWNGWNARDRGAFVCAVSLLIAPPSLLAMGYSIGIAGAVLIILSILTLLLLGVSLKAPIVVGLMVVYSLISVVVFFFAINAALDRFKLAASTFGGVLNSIEQRRVRAPRATEIVSLEDASLKACSSFRTDMNEALARNVVGARLDPVRSLLWSLLTDPPEGDRCLELRKQILEIDENYPFPKVVGEATGNERKYQSTVGHKLKEPSPRQLRTAS